MGDGLFVSAHGHLFAEDSYPVLMNMTGVNHVVGARVITRLTRAVLG